MRYSVLGPLAVARPDGGPVPLSRPKDRAVLAALLIDPDRVVGVPTLIDRVWGEDAGDATLSSLHAAVSRLRKQLAGATIATEAPGYRLQLAREDVDALRFADLVTAARKAFAADDADRAGGLLDEGLRLWRGEPYADVRADFVQQEAARLWDLRLAALELQAELDLQLGRDQELVDRLPALVADHPLREGLQATLMTALYRVGRQAEALAVFERARERLGDELGVDPSPALQRLHTMVLRQDPTLASPEPPRPQRTRPAVAVVAAPEPDASIVGRDGELARAAEAWARAEGGLPTAVLISGEAGIGKTRLLEELARLAAGGGAAVGWGRCADGGNASAYWPWAEALSRLAAQRGQDGTRRALEGRGAPAGALLLDRPEGTSVPGAEDGPVGARQRLFDGVVAFLAALAAEGPVLLALEDLHWADDETLRLTEHVLATASSVPLLLATTVRDPDESGRTRGRDLLATAARTAAVAIPLGGLDVAAVQAFASARLETEVADGTAARLHRRTDGNPFFIAELVRLLAAERTATGRADVDVPKTVQAVLERRFAHLGDDVRRTLAAAAVLGRECDVRLLAAVLGRRPLDLLESVDAASASGVLVPADDGRYRFTHALVQETLLAGLGPMRRAALHAQAAEAIEAANAASPERVAADLARHLLAAGAVGDPLKAVRFSIVAARNALAQAAYGEAEAHLRRAVRTITADPASEAAELELEARTRLGELLTLTLGYNAPEVVEERRAAFRLATEVGTPLQLLSALWGAWGIALVSGDLAEAESLADAMRRSGELRGDAMLLLAHHIALGQIRWHQGRLPEARDLLRAAVTIVDGHHDEVPLEVFMQHPAANSRAWLAIVLTLMGEQVEADAVAADADAVVADLGHPFTAAYLDVLGGWRAVWSRRIDEAVRISGRGLALSVSHGFDQLTAFLLGSHGWAVALSGEPDTGIPGIRQSIDAFESLPAGHMFGHLLHGVMAEALLERGDVEGAVREARIAIAESERTGERFFLPAVHLAAAAAQHRRGAAPSAVLEHLDAAAAIAAEQGAGFFVARTAEVRLALIGQQGASVR